MRRTTIPVQVTAFLEKGAKGDVDVANDVQRELVVIADDAKEDRIGHQFEEIWYGHE